MKHIDECCQSIFCYFYCTKRSPLCNVNEYWQASSKQEIISYFLIFSDLCFPFLYVFLYFLFFSLLFKFRCIPFITVIQRKIVWFVASFSCPIWKKKINNKSFFLSSLYANLCEIYFISYFNFCVDSEKRNIVTTTDVRIDEC